jgi:hypothetical protein
VTFYGIVWTLQAAQLVCAVASTCIQLPYFKQNSRLLLRPPSH